MLKTLSAVVLFCLVLSPLTFAEQELAQLSLVGDATLMVEPDQVTVILGVISEGETIDPTIQENSQRMEAIIEALKTLELSEKEYSTQRFVIHPQWSRARSLNDKEPSRIVGYQVQNKLIVKTTRLPLVGDIIQAATKAGANSVDSIQFGLSDARKYREQTITEAVQNAQADAAVLATASGNRLVKVLNINLNNSFASKHQLEGRARMLTSEASSVPPIQAGQVEVQASVSVSYEIAELP